MTYLFATCSDLCLLCAPDLFHPVLSLLSLLSSRLFPCRQSVSNQPVFGFNFLRVIQCLVNQSKASGLSASELSVESKHENQIRTSFVSFGQLFPNLLFRDSGSTGVQNVHDLVNDHND
jgi:hypothetical protein